MKRSLFLKYINAAILFGLVAPTAQIFSATHQNGLRKRAVEYTRSTGVDFGKSIRSGAQRAYRGTASGAKRAYESTATGLKRVGAGLALGREKAITRAKKEQEHVVEGAQAALKRMKGKKLSKKEQDHLYSFEKRSGAFLVLLALLAGTAWMYTRPVPDDGDVPGPPGPPPGPPLPTRDWTFIGGESVPVLPPVTESELGVAPELRESTLGIDLPGPPLPPRDHPPVSRTGRRPLPPTPPRGASEEELRIKAEADIEAEMRELQAERETSKTGDVPLAPPPPPPAPTRKATRQEPLASPAGPPSAEQLAAQKLRKIEPAARPKPAEEGGLIGAVAADPTATGMLEAQQRKAEEETRRKAALPLTASAIGQAAAWAEEEEALLATTETETTEKEDGDSDGGSPLGTPPPEPAEIAPTTEPAEPFRPTASTFGMITGGLEKRRGALEESDLEASDPADPYEPTE